MEFHQIKHTHPTHTCGNNIALLELVTPWRLLDNASGLDAEDAWIHDTRRVAKAGKSSERLMPKALTRIRTWPGCGTGTGHDGSSVNSAVKPGVWRTAARMV